MPYVLIMEPKGHMQEEKNEDKNGALGYPTNKNPPRLTERLQLIM